MRDARTLCLTAAVLWLAGCESEQTSVEPIYDVARIEPQDIQVTVEAAGVVEPETTVEVKSKASGEILAVHAETGDVVEADALLVEVDQRTPRNQLAEAEASLVAAQARRRIAATQLSRAETLHESGTLTQTDFEQAQLELANAEAEVVRSEVAVENARIAMEDTSVRAPIAGTIIEKAVEPGMVISSPTQAVSDGTILMRMADLTVVQVRTLVDETDIGKIEPGMPAKVTVAAYPNQPFEGEVLKIEPLAIEEQNVTMFAVLIILDNENGLLKPGMNADVEVSIASRESAPAVPTAALRTNEDIPATAAMLGLDPAWLGDRLLGERGGAAAVSGGGGTISVAGRTLELPEGLDAERVAELIEKRRRGESLTASEQALVRPVLEQVFGGPRNGGPPPGLDGPPSGFAGRRGAAGRTPGRSVTSYQFGGEYWVIALRDGAYVPVTVRTGLTDLRYTAIESGLERGDEVLLLPSSSLYEQQTQFREFISNRFSSTPFQQ